MKNHGRLIAVLVLSGLLLITGCGRKAKQKAQAEAAASKAELEKTQAQLQKTTADRDITAAELKKLTAEYSALVADANTLRQSLTQTAAQLESVTAERNNLNDQIELLKAELLKLQEITNQTEPALYKVVFTTALSEDNIPLDELKEVSLNQKRFTVFIRWRLPIGDHTYQVKIFDGSGKLASDNPVKFHASATIASTWYEYAVNKYVDQPGKWKFEIFLDGKKMTEEFLDVLPADSL